MSQSEQEIDTPEQRQARENATGQAWDAIGFGFAQLEDNFGLFPTLTYKKPF